MVPRRALRAARPAQHSRMKGIHFLWLVTLTLGAFTLQAAEKPRTLSLEQARELALKKHPRISVAELKSLGFQSR